MIAGEALREEEESARQEQMLNERARAISTVEVAMSREEPVAATLKRALGKNKNNIGLVVSTSIPVLSFV